MEIGMVGLGRMGANMVRVLLRKGHQCVVYDLDPKVVGDLVKEGARGAKDLKNLVGSLPAPRTVWVMVPAGDPTEHTVNSLALLMEKGDAVIDGGNSYFKDDVRRARDLKEKDIFYVDVGTSGGIWGLERGYCLMIGGEREIVLRLDPLFKALAPGRAGVPGTKGREKRGSTAEEGYLHCGPPGAGHFVKMVHNGIEYGLMQAYAEGFDILHSANSEALPEDQHFEIDTAGVAELWRRGSVVSSWLLDLIALALLEDPDLSTYSGTVSDSGEGRWTVMTAVEEAVPADVISAALFARFRSRQEHTFAEKLLSAMRRQFGGHPESGTGRMGRAGER
jgi:6-phosphogluconate dehydrogenase